MKVFVTGAAGFIGFHTVRQLLQRGDSVVGFDSVNDYYDPQLKESRLTELDRQAQRSNASYYFVRSNLADKKAVERCFAEHEFDRVIHLAAQAGVRYSLQNPEAYVEANLVGFTHILEACRHARVPHLVYASTSSVYGANTKMPFSEHHGVDHPLQFYAATKRANELMAHAYSHLFSLPTTGLRFFTVYGPWGRPDMALFVFTKDILAGKPIQIFNNGNHIRDFTYIDDIVSGVLQATDDIAEPDSGWNADSPDPARSNAPFRILNLGANRPVQLMAYIEAIENVLGMKAKKEFLPLQAGDVPATKADVSEAQRQVGYYPKTSIQQGVRNFVSWYREYYGR